MPRLMSANEAATTLTSTTPAYAAGSDNGVSAGSREPSAAAMYGCALASSATATADSAIIVFMARGGGENDEAGPPRAPAHRPAAARAPSSCCHDRRRGVGCAAAGGRGRVRAGSARRGASPRCVFSSLRRCLCVAHAARCVPALCARCHRPVPRECVCDALPASPLDTLGCVVIVQHPHEHRRAFATVPLLQAALANCWVRCGGAAAMNFIL